jgi:hypothetical protein
VPPFPSFTQIQSADLGEGELRVYYETRDNQHESSRAAGGAAGVSQGGDITGQGRGRSTGLHLLSGRMSMSSMS